MSSAEKRAALERGGSYGYNKQKRRRGKTGRVAGKQPYRNRRQPEMKRVLAVLAVLALLVGLIPAVSAEESFLYRSDFSRGTDGWYTWDPCKLQTKNKALGIRGRTESWNSPRRDFPLEPGVSYHISVEVRQTLLEGAAFMISAAHSRNGSTTYENLVISHVPKGKWTRLEAEWVPGEFDDFTLYVETYGDPTLDFEIRNFCVSTGYSASERFVRTIREDHAKSLKPAVADMKAMPLPDFMTDPGAGLSAWLPGDGLPELAEIAATLEDNVLSVTVGRKVDNIYVVEYKPDYSDTLTTYSSSDDRKNPKRNISASVTLKNPKRNEVEVTIQERIKEDKTEYYIIRRFTLNPDTPGLDPVSTHANYQVSAKDYPPYDKIKGAVVYRTVDYRPDGSVSEVGYDFSVKASLYVRITLDENGKTESSSIRRNIITRQENYSIEVRTGGNHRVNQFTTSLANEQYFTLLVLDKKNLAYYREEISKAYKGAALLDPELIIWTWFIDFGSGGSTRCFLTRDELFTVDGDGRVRYNEDARDLNGEPFPDAAVLTLLEPELCTLPLIAVPVS